MKTRWFGGRAVWGVVGLVVLAAVIAGGASADTRDKDRGYIGVYMQNLSRSIKEGLDLKVDSGVLISDVEDDSPAAEAGLAEGDVVVEFAGKKVASPDELRELVGDTKPGEKVKVVVIRDGDRKTLDLEVGERPEGMSFGWNNDNDPDVGGMRWFDGDGTRTFRAFLGGPRLGVTATELNGDLAGYFDTKAGDGVLVIGVEKGSIADKAGIKSGDVIRKVDDQAVESVDDLRKAMRDYDEGDQFDVSILRKGKSQTVEATMDDQEKLSFWSGDDAGRFHENMRRFHVSPRVRVHADKGDIDDDMHQALDELRDEMKRLKKELKEMKKDR